MRAKKINEEIDSLLVGKTPTEINLAEKKYIDEFFNRLDIGEYGYELSHNLFKNFIIDVNEENYPYIADKVTKFLENVKDFINEVYLTKNLE